MSPLMLAADGRRISYAQNGEDIVLLRAFQGQAVGFWIDVGANHPVNDSVTKNFSDLGWKGINIEPVESFHQALVAARPRDINVRAALSDTTGSMVFHRNDSNLDLSSFDEELVDSYRARGDVVVDIEVPVFRLAEICEEHLDGRPIDFLKVDTEGHELAVIRGHDFERFPIRVVLAEATAQRLPDLIEALEVNAMKFVFFDGLNAWFVHESEAQILGDRVGRPASPVLDWYHPAVYLRMMSERDERIAGLLKKVDQCRCDKDATPSRSLIAKLRSRWPTRG